MINTRLLRLVERIDWACVRASSTVDCGAIDIKSVLMSRLTKKWIWAQKRKKSTNTHVHESVFHGMENKLGIRKRILLTGERSARLLQTVQVDRGLVARDRQILDSIRNGGAQRLNVFDRCAC